jgi:hypothetical protein
MKKETLTAIEADDGPFTIVFAVPKFRGGE